MLTQKNKKLSEFGYEANRNHVSKFKDALTNHLYG
jgi:hypothetical protein